MMGDLIELAERCEAATGPDCELHAAIAAAVHLKQLTYQSPEWIKDPEFTASFDAAMQLVPEEWHITHFGESRFMTRGPFSATLETWGVEQADDGSDIRTTPNRRHGVAATPALALCAAALRARASQEATAQPSEPPRHP